MEYIKRAVTDNIITRLKHRKIIAVTGARQTGKTTLCKNIIPSLLNSPFKYFTFDDPDERIRFKNNAVSILERIKEPLVILDEIQKIPELFDPLKYVADKEGQDKKFIITGSSQILLLKSIKETLAGRISLFNLYPLSFFEASGKSAKNILLSKILKQKSVSKEDIENITLVSSDELRRILIKRDESIKWGGYPPLWRFDNDIDKSNWLRDYKNTYMEKDVSDIGGVLNPDALIITQKLLALRTGQILSISEIAKETGVTANTVKRYIYILNATFQCFLLRPYFENTSKRLIKSPKVFFMDTGLNKIIAGEGGISEGSEYETWVFSELMKWKELQESEPELYFYRSAGGLEIDFILKTNDIILPIEVKSSLKVDYSDGRGVESFIEEHKEKGKYKNKPYVGIIVYPGKEIKEIRKGRFAVPDWFLFR